MHSYGVRTSALKSQTCLARMTIDRMGMKIVEKYLGVPKKEARGAKRGGRPALSLLSLGRPDHLLRTRPTLFLTQRKSGGGAPNSKAIQAPC